MSKEELKKLYDSIEDDMLVPFEVLARYVNRNGVPVRNDNELRVLGYKLFESYLGNYRNHEDFFVRGYMLEPISNERLKWLRKYINFTALFNEEYSDRFQVIADGDGGFDYYRIDKKQS